MMKGKVTKKPNREFRTKYLLIRLLDLSMWCKTAWTALAFSDSKSFAGSFTPPPLLSWTSLFALVGNTATRKAGCMNKQLNKKKLNHIVEDSRERFHYNYISLLWQGNALKLPPYAHKYNAIQLTSSLVGSNQSKTLFFFFFFATEIFLTNQAIKLEVDKAALQRNRVK